MIEVAEDRKNQIHQVACRMFREQGFHGTSVRDIAEEVGIRGGSLYAHMECKEDLLWEILNAAADRFLAALRGIVESNLGITQKLREAIVAHVKVIAGDMDAAAVYTMEWRHLAPERRQAFANRRDEYERFFRGLVSQAIHERFISPPDAASATLFILSALNWVFAWFRHDGPMTAEEVGRMLADYVLDGLRRRTA